MRRTAEGGFGGHASRRGTHSCERSGLPYDRTHAEAVRDQVRRLLDSPEFFVPERARRFLPYVVEEALCGRGDRLKAFSIATQVLGRDSSFDASTDPVVRIEAAGCDGRSSTTI